MRDHQTQDYDSTRKTDVSSTEQGVLDIARAGNYKHGIFGAYAGPEVGSTSNSNSIFNVVEAYPQLNSGPPVLIIWLSIRNRNTIHTCYIMDGSVSIRNPQIPLSSNSTQYSGDRIY